ncbi:MAG: hypothetical protein N3D20_00370 [Candidatus Pacearchaeota archaeon]|nr:hypothetical protein [Candidatus Pacearchaeota archaeon]
MKKKGFVFLIGIYVLIFSMVISSATITFNNVYLNDTDNFYSNYSGNNIINVRVNVTNTSRIVSFFANFSNLTTSCGAGGIVNFSYLGDNIWNASCNVGNQAAISNFVGGPIIVVAINQTGSVTTDNSLRVVLYNFSVPVMPQGCQRFGPLTTNFTSVLDFARVNFVIHVQNNFTCMIQQMGVSGPPTLSASYIDVMIMNMTSVNLSDREQAQKLSNLPSYLRLNLSQPKAFPNIVRIFVNASAFAALDTNTSIKLLNLPFITKPNVSADNPDEILNILWESNGYDNGFQVITGNLTINVLGFSEYNATDIIAPTINIISPKYGNYYAVGTNNFIINISLNGTGTEISKFILNITNSTGQVNYTIYNSSINSANCKNISLGGEFYYCELNITLADGIYTINATAYDYGVESPGNYYSISQELIVDTSYPKITLISPNDDAKWGSSNSVKFKFNVSDIKIANCTLYITGDATKEKTDDSIDVNDGEIIITQSLENGNYEWYIKCTDYVGKTNSSATRDLKVDYMDEEDDRESDSVDTSSFWTNTYSPTDEAFRVGYTKELEKGERVRIKIGSETHYVGVIKVSSNKVIINVSSTPQQAELSIGEEKKFEVTNDNYYDISVRLNNIINKTKANLTVLYLHETIIKNITQTETNKTTNITKINETIKTEEKIEKTKISMKTKIILTIILIIIIGAVIFYYREEISEWVRKRKIKIKNNLHKH